MSIIRAFVTIAGLNLFFASAASAATYYIDFVGGQDTAAGTAPEAAWQHCPGDKNAKGTTASCTLAAGDKVVFKGGVTYRGSISITASGAEGSPIIFDGNTDGKFGKGVATISGGVPIDGLKPCASAAEADGNPHFANILTVPLADKTSWVDANLVQGGQKILHVAQDPNLPDPFFQEHEELYFNPHHPVEQEHSIRIEAVGMNESPERALVCMIDGGHESAVINKLNGGAVKITWSQKTTFSTFGITPQPNYTWPKDFELYADGKQVLKASLTPPAGEKKAVEQRFPLPAPVTATELVVKFVNAQPNPPSNPDWGAIASLKAYDADNKNVLLTDRKAALADPAYFTQTDPHYWDGAVLALHTEPNIVIYSDVLGFDPAKHEVTLTAFNNGQYKETKYSIMNSLKVLDQPGEYVVKKTDTGGVLYVWPMPGVAPEIERSVLPVGLNIVNASHVAIRGLRIQQFAASKGGGIDANGASPDNRATDILLDNDEFCFNRSQGNGSVGIASYSHIVVQNCNVHDNAGHMRGIVARNSNDVLFRKNRVVHNAATGIDFYTCTDGAVLDCDLDENHGMHANGITFYVGCKNILVEGNRVRRGYVALTFSEGDGIIIRNNFLQSDDGFDIGVWAAATPYNNIIIANNTLISSVDRPAIYGGNDKTENMYVVNNVMDTPGGNATIKGVFEKNVILTDHMPMSASDLAGNNIFVTDLKTVFKNPGEDYELASGSPAAGAGIDFTLAGTLDVRGAPRAGGKDMGAYSLAKGPLQPDHPWVHVDLSSFKFPAVVEPTSSHPKPNFDHVSDKPEITVAALDYTGQGGGTVTRREENHYFANWSTKDQWVEWTIDAPAAGKYELCIEEGAAGPSQRSFQLNGQPVAGLQDVDMIVSGDWKKFQEHFLKVPLELQAGKNTLHVVNPNATPLNFRKLSFYRVK